MIDVQNLQPCALKALPLGAIFLPAATDAEPFLAGHVGQASVLINLGTERPFSMGPRDSWSRAPGLMLENVRFEVDHTSTTLIHTESDAPLGSLIRFGASVAIMGADKHVDYAVRITEPNQDVIGRGAIAFARWRIVLGESQDKTIVFQWPLSE